MDSETCAGNDVPSLVREGATVKKQRILVVEDEALVAEDLRQTLLDLGYEVPAVTRTGEEAVESVTEERPDLVLMDILLNGELDGIKAAREIHGLCDVPVVFLTGYTDRAALRLADESGAYGCLVKPVSDEELKSIIEIALERHGMEKKE
jgi:CheY-like chemotaxis protein